MIARSGHNFFRFSFRLSHHQHFYVSGLRKLQVEKVIQNKKLNQLKEKIIMFQDLISVFRSVKDDRTKTFFVGESVSILPEYYTIAQTNSYNVPTYGWTIRSISGEIATLVRGVLHTNQKVHIECKYLKSE